MAHKSFAQPFDAFIAKLLAPVLNDLPLYLRDSSHAIDLLSKIRVAPDQDIFLGKLDVVDLYNSLRHADINSALRFYLNHLFDKLRELNLPSGPFSVDVIMELLDIANSSNFVVFNGFWYRQVVGIAMGRALGVAAAVLTLAHAERSFPPATFEPFIFLKRYIDDIPFIGFGSNRGPINRLIALYRNRLGITLTIEAFVTSINGSDPKSVDVLDFTIRRNSRGFDIVPYEKPTNLHLYIPPKSNHPVHSIAWIRAFLQRLSRNSSNLDIFIDYAAEFFRHLRHRGFRHSVLIQIFGNFDYNSERVRIWLTYEQRRRTFEQLVTDKIQEDSHAFFWVIPHNPSTKVIKWKRIATIASHIGQLHLVLPKAKFSTAWSSLPNLAALLQSALLSRLQGNLNPNPNPNNG
jgi:hypothetical protein